MTNCVAYLELFFAITVTPRDAAGEDRLTRNGTPLPGIEVRVTNPEDPKTGQPNDMPGEIQFRGVNAFRAYCKNPAETAATIIDDGWVKVGGENVSPLEVEALLSTLDLPILTAVTGEFPRR